jgi:hypothetical protein
MVRYVPLCNLTQSIEETETWADGIIETAKYKGVFTSLFNTRLVSHIGKGCDSVVIMPNAENHLPTFTRNVRLVPVTHLVLSSNRIRNAFTKANFNIFNIC